MNIKSKLPKVGTTIFTVMSALANKHKAINLSQGFPNYDCDPALKALVNHYIQKGYNQYAPMAGVLDLRKMLAEKNENLYGRKINPETEITITAGATQAIFTAIAAFVSPGDEVVIIEPAYDSYRPAIEVCGGLPRAYELKGPDYAINWSDLRKLVNIRTRMIIINTPHNPTGTILTEADMLQLQEMTKDSDTIILSDEVYEHLIFDGEQHQSVQRFPALYERSLATYSFGKTFHATGWKIGYCIGPEYLMAEFRKVHQFNVFCVNHPFQQAIAIYLKDPQKYLSLNSFYQEKRDLFLETIKNSRFKPLHSKGTYFQLLDYSAISDSKDTEFAKWMTREQGVASIPVSVFYTASSEEKVIRICFAKTEELLREAGALMSGM